MHYAATRAGKVGAAGVVDLLLRQGADEQTTNGAGRSPMDMIDSRAGEEDNLAEEYERMRQLLENAPADRAWRRCFLVLCRAHYPGGRGCGLGRGEAAAATHKTPA